MYKKITDIGLLIVIILVLALGATILVNNAYSKKDIIHERTIDSLNIVNNVLKRQIKKNDSIINVLYEINTDLNVKILKQKTKIIYIDRKIEVDKYKIDNLNKKQLVDFYKTRYPKDTSSNKLPLSQPILISVAKDLIELDGVKQKLEIKDSIIELSEKSLIIKDEIISKYVIKEDDFKRIIKNKDIEVDIVVKDNNELKKQNRRQRFIHYSIIGGLAAGLLLK